MYLYTSVAAFLFSAIALAIPASVLLLYLAPLLLFAREMKRAGPKARPYAVAGMLLVICYLGFGLTQAFLTHNNGVTMFAFLLAVLWTSLRGHEHEGLNDPQAHAWRKR